ncbi:MAG TPA: hypothetical protein VFL72_01170 [Acidimicrobiia bacterium]|nr:hypothetical protein [Acidimicrobiia bacterium]
MTERPRLESRLSSLADLIDWPVPPPELTTRVMATIESEPRPLGWVRWRRPAVALATVAVVTGVMVLSPGAREAVADLFAAAGIRISLTNDPAPPAGADLELGEPIDLVDVVGAVDFVVRVPTGEEPGAPDGVYLGDDGEVSLVWAQGQTLPAAGDTDVGLLLAQRQVDAPRHIGDKALGRGTEVLLLEVEGQDAVWIEGTPHTLTFLDRDDQPVEETTRLAANVLLWEANGVNHRLETTGDLESALAIVETLEAMS